MKKTVWLWIGLLVLVIFGGVLIWLMVSTKSTPPSVDTSTNTQTTTTTETSTPSGEQPLSGEVAVDIKNMAFTPATIKIKKGTKVTWTNQDGVGHNATADQAVSGGLPTDPPLLSKGQTQSFTFNTAGTFAYHCTPHPFMKGTVEVVE